MSHSHDAGMPLTVDRAPEASAAPGARVDVAAVIDGAPIGAYQRRIFALCFLVSMLDGFDTQSIAFVAPSISAQWNLPPASFGPIFSATLFGSVIGASVIGRLADRYGRKWFTVFTVALFGAATLACAFATSAFQLLILRLIAGLGLGGAIPNFMALAAEYAPQRMRSRIVVMTLWGFPLGAVIGGILSTFLISRFGWPAVFIVGGVLPLVLILVLIGSLPESIRFLALRPQSRDALTAIMRRIDASLAIDPRLDFYVAEPASESRGSFRLLFTDGRAANTVLFSAVMFMSLLLSYLLINWVPLLLQQAGLAIENAVLGAVTLNFAGILGSYLFSRRMDKVSRPITMMVVAYVLSAVAVAAIGRVGASFWPIMSSLFVAGFLLIGIQMAMSAFIANVYPTSLRGTAIGSIQGVGRLGSLLGPLIGGALLAFGMTPTQLFQSASIPALLAACALLLLGWFRRSPHPSPASLAPVRDKGSA